MKTKLLTSLVICTILVLTSMPAMAVRNIALPYEMKFDSGDDWSNDLKWVVNGATGGHVTSGCWSGGCARFTPPTFAVGGNGKYSGLGSFTFSNTKRINIRMLVKIGSRYESTSQDTGYGEQNKFIIVGRSDSGERGMTILEKQPYATPYYWSYGACEDNTCTYQCGGSACNRPNGNDLFKTIQHSGEWFCLELESDLNARISKVYIWTQDGSLNGLYSTHALTDLAGYYNAVQIIGGFFNGVHTTDANTYVMFDELRISNTYIGPPAGFTSRLQPPPNFQRAQ